MADQIMTAGNELSVIVPEVWSRRFYDVLLTTLPFASIIDSSYEGEIQNLGDTVKISTFPEFDEAQELPEGARNDAEALTVTQQLLVINKRIVKDFIVTNRAQLQSLPQVLESHQLLKQKAISRNQNSKLSQVLVVLQLVL